MVLSTVSIKKAFGTTEVLRDVSFNLDDREKAALIGVNGAGKTTLFKIITGELEPDSGTLAFKKGESSIGYLAQMLDLDGESTIHEALLSVFRKLIEAEAEIRDLETKMGVTEGDELKSIMKAYDKLTLWFEEHKGYEYKSRIRGVIKGLGFSDSESEKKIKTLSGGQKTRVSLGKLLLSEPDLLLLDEPTNHLDIESVEWLEEYLKAYPKAVLIISHDRYFINKIVTKIVEIENGRAETYLGDYSYYAKKKETDRQIKLKHYLDQQKEIKRQEEIIKTLKSFNREKSIKRAESREKLLDKIERVEKPEQAPEKMRIKIRPKKVSGNDVLTVKDLKMSFGEHELYRDAAFEVKKGERVALIGPNGVGKTTMLRNIMDMVAPDSGYIRHGANVVIGYYDQEHQNLDLTKSIFQEIMDTYPDLTVLEIRNALASFVFTGDDVYKRISELSGGEKGRVALTKIILGQANFLILDEPTNHLDIFSKEILEEALNNYEGSVLYISHDRYFINNTATKILELSQHGIKTYIGDYDYYIDKRIEEPEPEIKVQAESAEKAEHLRKKENRSEERKRKTKIRQTEDSISDLESKIQALEKRLTDEEVFTNHLLAAEVTQEKTQAEEQLTKLYELWEELHL